MRTEVPYDQIDPKPDNARRQFVHLDELALSIGEYGLLQNLILKEKADGRFQCEGGERRRRAIGLLMLTVPEQIKEYGKPLGAWYGVASTKSGSESGGVPCFVLPKNSDDAAHLIENIGREDLWPWELGRKLALWNDAGYDQEYIANRICKSQPYVSTHIAMGKQLSRAVSEAIEKTGDRELVSMRHILKMCRLYDPVLLEPMHKAQIEMFEKVLGTPRTRGIAGEDESRVERTRVHERAKKLGRMKVPGHAKLYVRAIYEYLFGEKYTVKPDFNFK